MDENFYMTNRQKLLFMVKELHIRGFGKLRIIPSISPSGVYWRCNFIDDTKSNYFIASNWISSHEKASPKLEITMTSIELADLFMRENFEFLEHCKGVNEEYQKWYIGMLEQLTKDELPYAFDDWEMTEGIWKTSKGSEIKTLPNEQKYYF